MLSGSISGWAKPPFFGIVSSHDSIIDVAPDHFRVVALQFSNLHLTFTYLGGGMTMLKRSRVTSTCQKGKLRTTYQPHTTWPIPTSLLSFSTLPRSSYTRAFAFAEYAWKALPKYQFMVGFEFFCPWLKEYFLDYPSKAAPVPSTLSPFSFPALVLSWNPCYSVAQPLSLPPEKGWAIERMRLRLKGSACLFSPGSWSKRRSIKHKQIRNNYVPLAREINQACGYICTEPDSPVCTPRLSTQPH